MTLDNLVRKTVLRTARDFDDPAIPLVISNLKQCYVYILACLAEVIIRDCTDSVIVTGVSRLITLENCNRCTLISISKSLKIQGCSNVTTNVCVNTRPVLSLGNANITLAPYNSFYSQLDAHIKQMGIKTTLADNFWNFPMDYNKAKSSASFVAKKPTHAPLEEKQVFSLIDPEKFTQFVVPFQLPGNTKANPIELPADFTQALQQRAKTINSLKTMIESVPDSMKEELQMSIEENFREWLVASGNIDQINDLINFHLQ